MGLTDELGGLSPTSYSSHNPSWHETMRRESPEDFRALVELVQDWLQGGSARRVFRHRTQMFRWLTGQDPDRPRDRFLPAGVRPQAFSRFMNLVDEGAISLPPVESHTKKRPRSHGKKD